MACFMYHTKSCPHRMLILVLAHGERPSSLTIVQLVIVASRFVFAAIGCRYCLPSCKSSLGLPFKKEVQ
eukprot:12730382-Ditylum_brightwellii.AAC.1